MRPVRAQAVPAARRQCLGLAGPSSSRPGTASCGWRRTS